MINKKQPNSYVKFLTIRIKQGELNHGSTLCFLNFISYAALL
jgi:hypothetical protein